MSLLIISMWYITHVTEWINPTWHHVCIALNKYVEYNNVTVTTVFKWGYYCCWFTHHLTIRPVYYTVKTQWLAHAMLLSSSTKWVFKAQVVGVEVGGMKYSSACTLTHKVHPVLQCSLPLCSLYSLAILLTKKSISSPSPLGWDLVCASCLPG